MVVGFRLIVAGLMATLVAAFVAFGSIGDVTIAHTGPVTKVECSTSVVVFGEKLQCSSNAGGTGHYLDWSDGHISDGQVDFYAPEAVGLVTVSVIGIDGLPIASQEVLVKPDLSVVCEQGAEKDVYELVASDTRDEGWDYVYVDPDTDERILPGDEGYPTDPGLTPLDLVLIETVNKTGECRATSEAADLLGGDFDFTMGTRWEQNTVPFTKLTPWSKSHWVGTQPGFIEVTVTVDGHSASERQDVYLSGCN